MIVVMVKRNTLYQQEDIISQHLLKLFVKVWERSWSWSKETNDNCWQEIGNWKRTAVSCVKGRCFVRCFSLGGLSPSLTTSKTYSVTTIHRSTEHSHAHSWQHGKVKVEACYWWRQSAMSLQEFMILWSTNRTQRPSRKAKASCSLILALQPLFTWLL